MLVPKMKAVNAISKYKLQVLFNDGTEGIYDVAHLAGKGVFKAWEEKENFYKVHISSESGAITWPGELDIDTVNVYCKIKEIEVDEYLNSTARHATYI